MKSPGDPAFNQEHLHALTSALLDGSASESQLKELTALLREDPEARDEYLMLVDLHAALSTQVITSASAAEPTAVRQVENAAASSRSWMPVAAAAALAACLLIAVTWFRPNIDSVKSGPFVSIAQGKDVVWKSDPLAVGDRVGATTLQLVGGVVRLEFDSGVEITLEGPAEFRVIDVTKASLASGVLTATVPPGAEGFAVDTPSAQVIDLGTSFGIDIGSDGFSSVSVFDGEVEVAPRDANDFTDSSQKRLLTEGESIRIGAGYEVQDIRFDMKPFEKIWPTASGIAGSTDSVRFVPPWPKQIRFVQSDNEIFVRPEGPPLRLTDKLQVNVSEPGACATIDDLTPATVEANRMVRSYILHYSPESQLGPRRAKRLVGSITFASPVIGLMVVHDQLAASSRRFGRRGAGEANQRRELNLSGDETGDRITLSEDRKTITLDLIAPGRTSDLVRVIVEGRRRSKRNKNLGGGF